MAKKRTAVIHSLLFGDSSESELNARRFVFVLGGKEYGWTPERGRFPRPPGWATKGKVYLDFDPTIVLGTVAEAAP
jgi:hypothetical protein